MNVPLYNLIYLYTQEIFGFAVAGGTLIIAAPGGEKDVQYLARMCKQHDVSCCIFVPSQLDALLRVCPMLAVPRLCHQALFIAFMLQHVILSPITCTLITIILVVNQVLSIIVTCNNYAS